MINREKKFIFVRIPKTAGTSMQVVLEDEFGLGKKEDPHCTPDRYSECWEEYFKFTFVRNPWDRLVSTYYFDADPARTAFMDRRRPIRAIEKEHGAEGFSRFVETCLRTLPIGPREAYWGSYKPAHRLYSLYWPQARWMNKHFKYDFVGRFETLQKDFAYVSDQLGSTFPLPHKASSSHRPYQEYYNSETKKIVAEVYSEDIKKFGYEF